MFLMYVDESGDSGMLNSPTQYFVLSGLVIHELRWRMMLERLVSFRQRLKAIYGLNMREEIHSGPFIARPGHLIMIPKHDRLAIIRNFADELAGIDGLNIINVVVDKAGKRSDYDVFGIAWKALIQRFENTIERRNFSGPANAEERGMIFPDFTDTKKLTMLLRKLRHYNPVPSKHGYSEPFRNLTLNKVIEDPNFRDSKHSLAIQAADLSAFLLYQFLKPSGYIRKKGAANYFLRLSPVHCKVASPKDTNGIVRI